MDYKLYVDTFWIMVFLVDLVAMTGMVYLLKHQTRLRRLLGLAAISASIELLLYLWLPWYWLYRILMVIVIHPFFAFGLLFPSKKTNYVKGYLLINGLLLIVSGAQTLIFYWIPGLGQTWGWQIGMSILCVILCIKQQRKAKQRQHIYEVQLMILDHCFTLRAFHDTGNFLQDPFTGKAVSVVEKAILPINAIDMVPIRYIPYRTVGQQHGLIEVITIDEMTIKGEKDTIQIKQPVIGLSENRLFLRQDIHMILHSELL